MREVQALKNGGIYGTIYIKSESGRTGGGWYSGGKAGFFKAEKGKKLSEFLSKCHIIFDISYAVPAIDFSGENDKINNRSRKRGQPPGAASVKYVFDTRRE